MKITESTSHYRHLEDMTTHELLENINKEDRKVPLAVSKVIDQIQPLVDQTVDRMLGGGRLFYVGAGTSGRLGIVDASECPPTFGVEHGLVIGIIAGGDQAIRKAVEFAEDDKDQSWKDLQKFNIQNNDVVIGIAASGTTPYVVGAVEEARRKGLLTGAITCNTDTPLAAAAAFPIEVIVGPEFVTGSTRMKSGTAQKLVLNMISTSIMIKIGRIEDNKMVDMQLSNEKLVDRGTHMVIEKTGLDYEDAKQLLLQNGSVRAAVKFFKEKTDFLK